MDQPILKLMTELGREPQDSIFLSHYSPTVEWSTTPIKLMFADKLAEVFTSEGQNVYISVNPVEGVIEGRGSASAVTRLAALWADLDYKDSGIKGEAGARAVIESLSAVIHSNPVAIVHSGHGLQPYWAVEDGEISELNRNWVAGVLRRWGALVARFAEIEGGHVDSVYDLPRVLRAPGTINFKVAESQVPATLEIVEWSHPLNMQEINEVLMQFGFLDDNNTIGEFEVVSPPDDWEPAERDCSWAVNIGLNIDSANPKERHPWLLGVATQIEVAARNSCITAETYGELVGALNAKFELLLSKGDMPRKPSPGEVNTAFKWARARVSTFSDVKMADNLNYHSHRSPIYAVPELPKASGSSDSDTNVSYLTAGSAALAPEYNPIVLHERNFQYTDASNAERLAQAAQSSYIYVPGLGWHVWEKGRYLPDSADSIVRLATLTAKQFAEENPTQDGIKWAQKSLSAPLLSSAVRLAASVPEIVVMPAELDAEPLELCTPDGIVELDRGVLRPAQPGSDRHTRQTAFSPAPGPMPKFQAFLKQVVVDQQRIDFLQALFGVALIGEVRWHMLPMFSGTGANGKSALLSMVGDVLGSYTAIMPENFLLDSGKLEHSTEIFRLRGVRLAIGNETKPGGKFNEARVKMLTAEPVLSARAMRQDFVDFKATHTLFLAMNHPPAVESGGDSFWRRIMKINFNVQIPEAERDERLPAKIVAEEGPQILAWLIAGAKRVLNEGLPFTPYDVVNATQTYREEEDHIAAWLDQCTMVDTRTDENAGFTSNEIYGSYLSWCKSNNQAPQSNVSLIRDIRNRMPLVPVRIGRQRGWRGLFIHINEEPGRHTNS